MAGQRRCKHSLGKILSGALVLFAFLAASLLSAAPQLHERLHPDADATSHICAVTMIAAGHCKNTTLPPVVAPLRRPRLLAVLPAIAALPTRISLPCSILEHAPPVFA
ncbi:MAG TPA: hypothetical protein VII74_01355 [Chthoniobacterales bacterium]